MMALSWTNDELLMNEELRKVGVKVDVVMNEPWAYECGLKDALVNDQKACQYPSIGIEMARSLCTMLAIPCEYVRLNYSTGMTKDSIGVDTYKPDYQEWLKGEIIGGDIDTTLPVVVETNSNLDRQLLDFTLPLFYMDAGLLVHKSMTPPGQLMMKPFSQIVWIVIAALILFAIAYDIFCRVLIARIRCKKVPTLSSSILINFGIITGRSVNAEVESWSRRVLYATTGKSDVYGDRGVLRGIPGQHKGVNQCVHPLQYTGSVGRRPGSRMISSADRPVLVPHFHHGRQLAIADFRPIERDIQSAGQGARAGRQYVAEDLRDWQFVLRASTKGNCNITIIPLTELSDRGSFAFRKRNYPYFSLFFKATISFKDKGDFYEQTELKYRFSRSCARFGEISRASGNSRHNTEFQRTS